MKTKKMNKWEKSVKVVYDLDTIEKNFIGIENMPILQDKSFSYSVREKYYNDSIVEFYDRNHTYLGQSSNSIGPYGKSDYWDIGEDGYVFSTDTPEVDFSVFVDNLYNVIVVRG